jgi:hypothetical protein
MPPGGDAIAGNRRRHLAAVDSSGKVQIASSTEAYIRTTIR